MQTDIQQKPEPSPDLFQKLFTDRPRNRVERNDLSNAQFLGLQFACFNPCASPAAPLAPASIERPANRHAAKLDQRLAADLHGARAGLIASPSNPGRSCSACKVRADCEPARLWPLDICPADPSATPAHVSACDQILLRDFQRYTIWRSPVP